MDNQLINLDITENDGKIVVWSRDIARVFEKNHQHVMCDNRNIIEKDAEWGASNFGLRLEVMPNADNL